MLAVTAVLHSSGIAGAGSPAPGLWNFPTGRRFCRSPLNGPSSRDRPAEPSSRDRPGDIAINVVGSSSESSERSRLSGSCLDEVMLACLPTKLARLLLSKMFVSKPSSFGTRELRRALAGRTCGCGGLLAAAGRTSLSCKAFSIAPIDFLSACSVAVSTYLSKFSIAALSACSFSCCRVNFLDACGCSTESTASSSSTSISMSGAAGETGMDE
mmetsp:Transcript_58330/g.109181  ORF Transcript_58330/g.109181 Transcript_58330/m.109181 type:complete len:213 (-) Transcript_58330:108-746(-)